jgi:hypothetical protein
MYASDAQWIAELHRHQERVGPFDNELPAAAYKIAIEHLEDSLAPTLGQAADTAFIKTEKARHDADRARISKLLGTRPLPSPEIRRYKGFIAGDSGCNSYHSKETWSFKRVLCNEDIGGHWKNMTIRNQSGCSYDYWIEHLTEFINANEILQCMDFDGVMRFPITTHALYSTI